MRPVEVDMRLRSPLRTGGLVLVHRPETVAELAELRALNPKISLVGALSNVVVFDSVREVISTRGLRGWEFRDNSTIKVACGSMMPVLVRELATLGYGGLEYLASVPGTVGGGAFMNAGRGRGKPSIADRTMSVTAMDSKGNIRTFNTSEMGYDYRWCRLLREDPELKIVYVTLRVDPVGSEHANKQIEKRLSFVRQRQDRGAPNLGSVFRAGCSLSLRGMQEGGMQFSEKTDNWIINTGKGTAQDYRSLVGRAKSLHVNRGHTEPKEEVVYLTDEGYESGALF